MPDTSAQQAALITAGGQLVGTAVGALAQGDINKQTRKWNEKMYAQQRADALADWNRTNQYNSPTAQMARLKEGGLNPNLVYGNGAKSEAAPVRSTDVKSWTPNAPNYAGIGNAASQGLQAYQDMRIKNATITNLATQNENTAQDTKLKIAQTVAALASSDNAAQDLLGKKFDLALKSDLRQNQLSVAQQQLDKLKADTQYTLDSNVRAGAMQKSQVAEIAQRILNMKAQNANTREELNNIHLQGQNLIKSGILQQLDINLKKEGIQPTDNMIFRIITQMLNKGDGSSFSDVWNAIKKKGLNNF